MTFALQTRRYEVLLASIPAGLLILWYKIGLSLYSVGVDTVVDATPVAYGTVNFDIHKANAPLKDVGCVNVLDVTRQASVTIRLLRAPGFLLILATYVAFSLALPYAVAKSWRNHVLQRAHDERHDARFLWNVVIILLIVSVRLPS